MGGGEGGALILADRRVAYSKGTLVQGRGCLFEGDACSRGGGGANSRIYGMIAHIKPS